MFKSHPIANIVLPPSILKSSSFIKIMKAFVHDSSAPDGVQFTTAATKPLGGAALKPATMLVRVKAVSLNPVDYKLPEMVPFSSYTMRNVPFGKDFAGVVEEAGPNSPYKAGDAVFGSLSSGGVFADLIVAPATNVARLPPNTSFAEAAGLGVAGVTGLQALGGDPKNNKGAHLKPGDSVIVAGASGGTGSLGVQIARALVGPQGKVVGICSSASAPAVRALGVCDELVDYAAPDAAKATLARLGPFDVLYDTVSGSGAGGADTFDGKPYADAMRPYLKPNTGLVVAINGTAMQWAGALSGWQSAGYKLFMADVNAEALEAVGALVRDGKLKAAIDSKFAFSEEGCRQALARVKSRRARGKVVVTME